MTTINGVTFNMQSLEIVSTHRNVPNEEIGTDESFITDMGYTGLILRMTGYEKTLAKYDEVINEFMKSGAHTMVYRTGWQFTVYSTQLVPLLDMGIVDNFFPYELTMLTSSPYRESSSLSCRGKLISSNNQEWSVEDTPCNNLIDNWSFEDWTAGASSDPDGWESIGAGSSIARDDTTEKVGTYCCKLTRSGAYTYINQDIPFYWNYKGKTLTMGTWVKATVADRARLRIDDGVGPVTSSFHTGGGDWEWLTVSIDVASNATELQVQVGINNADTLIYIDGAVIIEGDSILDNTFIRDIDTDGSVDAIPDIQITGGALNSTLRRNKTLDLESDATEHTTISTSYVLKDTITYTAIVNQAYRIVETSADVKKDGVAAITDCKITYTAASLNGGAETTLHVHQGITDTYVTKTDTCDILTANNEQLVVKIYIKTDHAAHTGFYKNSIISTYNVFRDICLSPQVYNTADTTVKCNVANEIEPDEIVRINSDATGTIEYSDDFSTTKYLDARWDLSGVTHDAGNDELDIADDGYIYYKKNVKYPVTGLPTLISHINITTGTPTIQISIDGITWYDIDTAIVDDVETEYELDSTSLHLAELGSIEFYYRFDCVKAGAATCSIKNFELNVDIVTIDVEQPKISAVGISTFRCDQGALSGLNCIVALKYRDRSWPA